MNFSQSLACVIGLGFVAGCNIPQYYAERDFEKTIPLVGPSHIEVETYNGYIEVTPCESQEVQLVAHMKASGETQSEAESRLDSLIPEIETEKDSIRIKAEKKSKGILSMDSVNLVLKVPATMPLTLTSSNGRISTIGTRAPVQIKTSNGRITVKNAIGKIDVHTSNGAVEIEESIGQILAHTSNGKIALTDCMLDGDTTLKTSNGKIEANYASVQDVSIDANTSNGHVSCDAKNIEIADKSSTSLRGIIRGEDSSKSIRFELKTSNGAISIKANDRASQGSRSTSKETN